MRNKFTMILQIILICTISTLAQRQWIAKNIEPGINLQAVYFLDKDVGWVCGGQDIGGLLTGVILSTNDGGGNWTKLQIEVGSSYHSFNYKEVFFKDINEGILAGSGGILRTTDGGQSWEIKHNADIHGMSFYDANNAMAVGSIAFVGEVILKTSDGGDTWLEQINPMGGSNNVTYLNNTTAFAVRNGSRIYRTTDGGNDWEILENPGEDDLFAVHFFDENFGTAVGDGTVLQTTDGGETWILRDLQISDMSDVYCASETECIVVGFGGTILHTTDGGLNWEYEESGTTEALGGIHFIDTNIGVVVGKNGTILKTEPPATGNIVGIVQLSGSGLENVLVKLLDNLGMPVDDFDDVYTDAIGEYSFSEVPVGDYQVMIVVPLGYVTDDDQKPAVVITNEITTVDFLLTEVVVLNNARSKGYWKHQFDVYVKERGNAQESEQDLIGYIDEVDERYNSLSLFSIFDGMTDGEDDFEEWQDVLSVKGNSGMEAKATAQLAALVLNIMSLKIAQYEVVTVDGKTAGDVLIFTSELIEDGDDTNDELAKDLAESVNNQQTIASGIVPEGSIIFKTGNGTKNIEVTTYELFDNYPNPFNPSTKIIYQIPERGTVSLKVYDMLGKEVTTLVEEYRDEGRYEIIFDAGNLASGIYIYQLRANNYMATKKMLLMK